MRADPKFLFFFAGYDTDCDKSLSILRKRLATSVNVEDIEFGSRKRYRMQPSENYWKRVADDVVDLAFGNSGATGYCSLDAACIDDDIVVKGRRCSGPRDKSVACRKSQPTGIVLFVPSHEAHSLINFFGLSVMIVAFDQILADGQLFSIALKAYERMKAIKDYFRRLPLENKVIFLPYDNFFANSYPEKYADLGMLDLPFDQQVDAVHSELYDHSIQNPVKRQIRGGYRFDDNIFFQRDRLHNVAKLGIESRVHGFHLLKAHFRFGIAVRPGMHFDVMREDGRPLNRCFADLLTGALSPANATHVNISPCDRLL